MNARMYCSESSRQKLDLEEEGQGYRHQFADERDGLTFFIRMKTYTKKGAFKSRRVCAGANIFKC